HVVQAQLVAERDRRRLAAVLAADAELERRLRPPPSLDRQPHQVADATHVQRLERIVLQNTIFQVPRQELALRVVAGEAERRLGQVVRAEREEVGVRGDLVRTYARARELDHRSDEV